MEALLRYAILSLILVRAKYKLNDLLFQIVPYLTTTLRCPTTANRHHHFFVFYLGFRQLLGIFVRVAFCIFVKPKVLITAVGQ
jgi:hypothetical protein